MRTLIRITTMIWLAAYLCLQPAPSMAAEEPAGTGPWELLLRFLASDVEKARNAFEETLVLHPDDPLALAGLAATLAVGLRFSWENEINALSRAGEFSLKALALEPDRIETQFARALVETLQLDFQTAEKRSRDALALPGPNRAARLSLGSALLHQGRWKEAEEVFRTILETESTDCAASAGLSDSLQHQERFQESIEMVESAILASPLCFPLHLSRAATTHNAGREAVAFRQQSALLEKFPESKDLILLNGAAMLLTLGRYRGALKTYQVLELPEGPPYFRLLRDIGISECHLRLNQITEAEREFRKLIQDFPPTTSGRYLRNRILFPAYISLSRILKEQGKRGAEIALLERGSGEADVPAGILLLLGKAYADLGLAANSRETLERAARSERFQDLHQQGRILILWLHGERGNRKEFYLAQDRFAPIEEFQRRVKEEGSYASYYALARVFALAGRVRPSIQWLEKAVEAGFRNTDSILREPDLEPIRHHRKFRRLLGRIGGK